MAYQIWLDDNMEILPRFLVSLAIGLLIGLERERKPSSKAGLRTFSLVALLGTLTAMLSSKTGTPWLLVAGFCIVGAMIIAAYLNSPAEENDPGTTTIAALVFCYMLGILAWHEQTTLAIMLAIVTTTLLYFKPELRGMSKRMARHDLFSILQFLVLTFVILPVLPDHNYGPYDAFNPYQIWSMVVMISGINLAGYIALHWTGQRYGAALLGFFGGLVSSTATTLIYARHGKSNEPMVLMSAIIILIASQVVLVRLFVVSAAVSPGLLAKLLPVIGFGLVFGLVTILANWHKLHTSSSLPMPKISNPAKISTALSFGLLYAIVLFFSAWLSDTAGNGGLYVVAIISGLTDMDAITLSSLHLFELHKLSDNQAITAIAIAFLSNMVFKFGMVAFFGGLPLVKQVTAGFSAMGAGVTLGLLIL